MTSFFSLKNYDDGVHDDDDDAQICYFNKQRSVTREVKTKADEFNSNESISLPTTNVTSSI